MAIVWPLYLDQKRSNKVTGHCGCCNYDTLIITLNLVQAAVCSTTSILDVSMTSAMCNDEIIPKNPKTNMLLVEKIKGAEWISCLKGAE